MQAGPESKDEAVEEISAVGYNGHVGPLYRIAPVSPDEHCFAFTAAAKHMNAAGTVHGGMLMSFIDVAMSHAARAASGAKLLSTIALNCDFVSPGRLGDRIEARVRVSRSTRSVVFLSGELVVGDRRLLVATGQWKIVART
jgi:uncharacterized protein (TIGR00369 family)